MKRSERYRQRRYPLHGVWFPRGHRVIVFLTVCTRHRRLWLATKECHTRLVSTQPDHLHLFAGPGELNTDFDGWVRYWKSQFSKSHRGPEHRWEVDHWDRRLRTSERYDEKWRYVVENPVRHRLAARAEDWPYQGGLFELAW